MSGGTAVNVLAREARVVWEYRALPDRDADGDPCARQSAHGGHPSALPGWRAGRRLHDARPRGLSRPRARRQFTGRPSRLRALGEQRRARGLLRHRSGSVPGRRESPRSSAVQARSIRRTRRTNSSSWISSMPAPRFCAAWRSAPRNKLREACQRKLVDGRAEFAARPDHAVGIGQILELLRGIRAQHRADILGLHEHSKRSAWLGCTRTSSSWNRRQSTDSAEIAVSKQLVVFERLQEQLRCAASRRWPCPDRLRARAPPGP